MSTSSNSTGTGTAIPRTGIPSVVNLVDSSDTGNSIKKRRIDFDINIPATLYSQ